MRYLLVSLALCASAPAFAQDYPTHPVTMVVAFPPGGVAELTGRPTAIAMEKVLGQRVIIENRPGAAGATGNAYVANSKP
ncbi:MAG TPA: tripartite tricarboxylate transporter substrate binding protein, partial [Burkholderiales bacterium]|nr:tripartite tricarboxylate transporter substrate binding protein [Burkholderiales bacterium]